MKRFLLSMLLLGSALAMSGCNTVQGAGKDIKRAGQGIENTAKDCGDRNGC